MIGQWLLGWGRQGRFGNEGRGAPVEMQGLAICQGQCMRILVALLPLALLCCIAQHLELHSVQF